MKIFSVFVSALLVGGTLAGLPATGVSATSALATSATGATGQDTPRNLQWSDYASYPEQPFSYHQLTADLELHGSDAMVEGEVSYELAPRLSGRDTLRLFASDMMIQQVEVNNIEVSYEHDGDMLTVELGEAFSPGERFELWITYQASPGFGVHRNANGTLWSSTLPNTTRFWMPSFDHSRVELRTDISVTVPDDWHVVMSGEHGGEQPASDDRKTVHWRSDQPLPLSDLGFAAGPFEAEQSTVNGVEVLLLAEEGLMDVRQRSELLRETVNHLSATESHLGYDYPYGQYTKVALHDDRWEPRRFAAAIGFAFKNHGDWSGQVADPLHGQWFGVYQRTETWRDAVATRLYSAWLDEHFEVADTRPQPGRLYENAVDSETVYRNFNPERHRYFRRYIHEHRDGPFVETLREHTGDLLASRGGTDTWRDFADFWYERSGMNWHAMPDVYEAVELPDTLEFLVQVETAGNELTLDIALQQEGDAGREQSEQTFDLPLRMFAGGDEYERELEFSGPSATLTLEREGNVENVVLREVRNPHVHFTIEKPFSFWLYQLRRDHDAERRADAARNLAGFEDPDLQLALNDRIGREEDPQALAELYRTLGEVAAGASGMQSRFLEGLDHQHREIQEASLSALRHYSGDSGVQERVFELIRTSEDIELVNQAIGVYRELIDREEFVDFADRFLAEDREALEFTRTLIDELFKTAEPEFAVERVEEYLGEGLPFDIRYQTYAWLEDYDEDFGNWRDRVESYYDDPDPRIRYLVLDYLHTLRPDRREQIRGRIEEAERDARVLKRLQEL